MGLLDRFRKKDRNGGEKTAADILIEEVSEAQGTSWEIDIKSSRSGRVLLEDGSREEQKNMVLLLLDSYEKLNLSGGYSSKWWKRGNLTLACMRAILRRRLPFSDGDLLRLCRWLVNTGEIVSYWMPLSGVAGALEHFAKEESPSGELKDVARKLAKRLLSASGDADSRKYGKKIGDAFGVEVSVTLVDGDVWAESAKADLGTLDPEESSGWVALLSFSQTANSGKPSQKWLKGAEKILSKIDPGQFRSLVVRWFALADRPATEERQEGNGRYRWTLNPLQMREPNQDALKGLAWCCSLRPDPEIIRAVSALCVGAFKKIPGIGARAARLGNACIYTLGTVEGQDALAQLALLKVKIRNRSVQNQIAKALQAAADREGVTPDDLEEMSVPEYGMTDVGLLELPMGEFTARLEVEGTHSTKLLWIRPDGKTQKSVPAPVKADFAEELKELRSTAKDIQKMLPAVSQRIDNGFLAQKSWTYAVWKKRYHDHPLTGSIARRLIWTFGSGEGGEPATEVIFHEGQFVDCHGTIVPEPSDPQTQVRLWHPLHGEPTVALQWRNWLEEHLVQQPFKQAHREVYLLTEAEENTGTYSNRFAAHIIRQHQFNALCLARSWRNQLRLAVDDSYPPASRELPGWGIRAEFWIEGIGGNYGVDTTESGTYLYLATDQVRFYSADADQLMAHAGGGGYGTGWGGGAAADPMSLTEVPPLVLSEIMRDVDLFVGVASVGNDPNWADGGPEGRHVDYWQSYSFGELSATAKTRKELLKRLLPKLKIAKKSRVEGKFLIVEGEVRTYKIHLGSGNILMEPNDQYLCIVPNASLRKGTDTLFLPFEGDNVMAIILSKAFLLADDKKIKDKTILSQIGR